MENAEVLQQWSAAARYWEKHRVAIEGMFAPITAALVEEAGIARGMAVLDVATGPGEPALGLSGLVGERGRVSGIDFVPAMIAAARREARRRGLTNVGFETASAGELPFEAGTFDAVVSRFGVMFFPQPLAGLREMARVLRPGGGLALAVWHLTERNPFHRVVADVLARFVEPVALDPDAPDAFRFAPSGKLLALAREAGFTAARERRLEFSIDVPLAPEDFWTLRTEMSEGLRSKLASLSATQVDEIRRLVLEAVRPHAHARGLSFPAEVLLVCGRR
jgi:ubiquinone/menaquinone biosynthesis C-methylase UbiE